MPSAQSLKNFIDQPLQWKVKLPYPPKHQLRYYFIRPDDPTDNPEEISRYNVEPEATRVVTSEGSSFDSRIKVELTVRQDGTVIPRFIYKERNLDHEIEGSAETGRPFALDMTAIEDSGDGREEHFVGFDFGTSTSSICTLDRRSVALTQSRQEDSAWTELGEALRRLPYPVSFPLRRYLDVKNTNDLANNAREVFEACMAFIAYCASTEASVTSGLSSLLSSFAHRSMGPLKQLLEQSLRIKNDGTFSSPYKQLMEPRYREQLNIAIKEFTDHKHEKLESNSFNYHDHLVFIVNRVLEGMRNKYFGYCLTSEPVRFQSGRYHGRFRVAHDTDPFIASFRYSASTIIPRERALLIDVNSNKGLDLFPFFFWVEPSSSEDSDRCFLLDNLPRDKGDPVIKPCNSRNSSDASAIDVNLSDAIKQYVASNPCENRYDICIENEED